MNDDIDRCGYEVTDVDGIAEPCDRPTTGWRWYEHCGHEPMLDRACEWHADEGGRRIHDAEAALAKAERERDNLRATNDRLNRRAQVAEAAINELANGTGRGKAKPVAAEVWARCQETHERHCGRAERAEAALAEVERERDRDRERCIEEIAYTDEAQGERDAWKESYDDLRSRVRALTDEAASSGCIHLNTMWGRLRVLLDEQTGATP